jgi:hypothetical protein
MHSDQVSLDEEASSQNSMATDAAGNIYILFNYYGTLDIDPGTGVVPAGGTGLRKATLAKYDPSGKLLWSKLFDTNGSSYAIKLKADPSGNIYCLLSCKNNATYLKIDQNTYNLKYLNIPDIFIKFNTSGSVQWVNEIGNQSVGYPSGILVSDIDIDLQGNIYAAGSFMGELIFGDSANTVTAPSNVPYYFLAKYNSDGKYVLAKSLFRALTDASDLQPASITIDNAQNVYLSGSMGELTVTGATQIGNVEYGENIIAKFDNNWNWLWVRPDQYNVYLILKTDADGNLYSLGSYPNNTIINKIGPDGTLLWNKNILTNIVPGPLPTEKDPESLSINSNNEILVTTDYNLSTTLSNHGISVNKFNSAGTLVYKKQFAGYSTLDEASIYKAMFDNNGNIDMMGFFTDSFKFFGNSSDPKYSSTDFKTSFFLAHFPDKP